MQELEPLRNTFIQEIIDADRAAGRYGGRVHTRFPPEPNGYLHIGHARAICVDFGLAMLNGGLCNLRFDDTNPTKEDEEYVQSIIEDVKWLGFDWGDRLYYASDYFEQLYEYAVQLIKKGKAYVCDLSPEEIREYRARSRSPERKAPIATGASKKTSTSSAACGRGSFPKVPGRSGPRSIWPRPTST